MSEIVPGTFVVHAKLAELGSAEVLSAEKDTLRLRFASGERSFSIAFTSQHLSVVIASAAPRVPAKAAKRVRRTAKARALKS